MSGRSPPLYCTLTLIGMQGHQTNTENTKQKQCSVSNRVVIIYCFIALTSSLSSPPLCQTPGCRSGRNRSTLFLFPTPSSPYCTLKVFENDSLRQPPAAHLEKRPRPQKSSRSQRRLNALTSGYLKGTVVRSHPMVWSLALSPDDTKQDSVVYGARVWRSVPGEGSTYCIHTRGPRLPPL